MATEKLQGMPIMSRQHRSCIGPGSWMTWELISSFTYKTQQVSNMVLRTHIYENHIEHESSKSLWHKTYQEIAKYLTVNRWQVVLLKGQYKPMGRDCAIYFFN